MSGVRGAPGVRFVTNVRAPTTTFSGALHHPTIRTSHDRCVLQYCRTQLHHAKHNGQRVGIATTHTYMLHVRRARTPSTLLTLPLPRRGLHPRRNSNRADL